MIDQLDRAFSRIRARVRFAAWPRGQNHLPAVRGDDEGEYFVVDLNKARDGAYGIQEVRPALRALMLRDAGDLRYFLCHHDGRQWRVDHDPLAKSKTIESALRPAPTVERRPPRVPPRLTLVPALTFQPTAEVLRREEPPVRRCRRLGFVAENECRVEQPPVFVGHDHPEGLSEEAWRDLRARDAEAFRGQRWRRVTRPARIHVRGWLWRPDRPLTTLRGWHEVRIQGAG